MGRRQNPHVDWALVEQRLKAGESAYSIARDAGVTKQGILQRATKEGWISKDALRHEKTRKKELRLIAEAKFKLSKYNGKATVDTKLAIIENIREGVLPRYAALAAGITEQTLINWKKDDLAFCEQLEAAAGEFVQEAAKRIKAAGMRGDWKADQFLLAKHPLAKQDYAEEKAVGGPQIQIMIAMPKPGQGELEPPTINITPETDNGVPSQEEAKEEEPFILGESGKPR